MRILVTGTAGFIGNALARRLVERGDQVIGIDNLSDYYDVKLDEARHEYGVTPARQPEASGLRL